MSTDTPGDRPGDGPGEPFVDTSYLFSGLPWSIAIAGPMWTLVEPDKDEIWAGVVARYNCETSDGRQWRLVAWPDDTHYGAADAIVAAVALSGRPMRWTLSRFGLDGPQHEVGGQLVVIEAVRRATKLLDEATSPDAVRANKAGDFCAMGGDPRHNVSYCPGLHT